METGNFRLISENDELLVFAPIIKQGSEYIQIDPLREEEFDMYSVRVYGPVIEKYFRETIALVNLKTGRFNCRVFEPIDVADDSYFCLMHQNGYPSKTEEISIEQPLLKRIKENLGINVARSEGIAQAQDIQIKLEFVTPLLTHEKEGTPIFYDPNLFNTSFILCGAPGAGKTTIMRRLTSDLLELKLSNDYKLNIFPVYIQLRDFNTLSIQFEDFVQNCITNYLLDSDFPIKQSFLLTSGRLFLLLDGADELDYFKFKSFSESIEEYKEKNPFVHFGISSRPDKSLNELKNFKMFTVLPFTENQIREITWRKLNRNDRWKDFILMLEETPKIYDILKNPLLLTFSHFLFLYKNILPINTGQLLKELVTVLVTDWDSFRKVERKFEKGVVNPDIIVHTLGKLGLVLSEMQRDMATADDLHNRFDEFKSSYELQIFLEYIEFSTGIISLDNKYGWKFNHKAMQDYFCSAFLVQQVSGIQKSIFLDKNWESVTQLMAGLSSDPDYIINIILKSKNHTVDKVSMLLPIFSESSILGQKTLEGCKKTLDKYFRNFEIQNKISKDNINVHNDTIEFTASDTKKKELPILMQILEGLAKLRFTKYELDFFGYFQTSTSIILQEISKIISTEQIKVFTSESDKKMTISKNKEIDGTHGEAK